MIRRKIRVRKALNWGLFPLMATTLLTGAAILMWLMSTNGRVLECTSEVWKTPALYLEHIGDEDKPINSIVIAASRPNERELGCAVHRLWMSPEVFLVKDEELAQATRLMRGTKPGGEGTVQPRESGSPHARRM